MSEQEPLTADGLRSTWVLACEECLKDTVREENIPLTVAQIKEFRFIAGGLFDQWLAKHDREVKAQGWDEGFNAGWAEAKDPGAFVNDVWDAKTPNPYTEAVHEAS